MMEGGKKESKQPLRIRSLKEIRRRNLCFSEIEQIFSNFFCLDFYYFPDIFKFPLFLIRWREQSSVSKFFFIHQEKENMQDVLIVIFIVSEWPPGFENKVFFIWSRGDFALWKKFEGCIRGKYFFKQKISLLAGELVGEWDRLREGDVYRAAWWEMRVEYLWIILEECFFYVLCSCGKKREK